MKKIIFLTMLLLTFGLLISGCEDQATQTPVGGGAFIGGSEGLAATFEPLSVVEDGIYTIFDSEDFSMDLVLKNKGEENVLPETVSLKLLGPSKEDFSGIPSWEIKNVETIEKVSEFNPEGGEEIVTFTPEARAEYTGTVTGFTDINWNLEYWYNYKTHLIVNDVCFKGDLTDPKVCVVKEAKTTSVSGAPISVTVVEEDVAGKGLMMLRIDVQNIGTGEATLPSGEFDYRFSQVAYSIEEPEKWECKSGGRENEARLIDGKAQIICRLKEPLSEDDLYTKNVRLTFDYVYKQLIQEKLRIKESLK